MASSRLIELLDALLAAEVEFVVIGGLAAVLHGAPLATHRRGATVPSATA